MPIYEYECTECAHRTEVLQRMDDAPLGACPECGGEVRRLISAPAVQFKGSGWYVTDYARKDSGSGNGSKGESSAPSDGGDAGSAAKKDKDGGKAKPKVASTGSTD